MWKRLAAAAALGAGLAAPGVAWAGPPSHSQAWSSANQNASFLRSCAPTSGPVAACDAILDTNARGSGHGGHGGGGGGGGGSTTPAGYGPSQLQSAYNLASQAASAGGGQTVAIVDAYDDPNAESDLGVYRHQFGLAACTTANGCFKKVNESGQASPLPAANGGWSQEISLDLDMVSAICPNCHILLVEASSASDADLGAAVDSAAQLGATEISNSYGGSETTGESTYDSHYDHPGIVITASSGDGGYGVEYPAASPDVVAVGGTTLTGSVSSGWAQTAWSGAGSGCSAYETQPSWQQSVSAIAGSCSARAVADVSADADPNTGVAVYDSYRYQHYSGWLVFGGTSVASPVISSVFALAGGAPATGTPAQYLYAHALSLTDVTSGSNGSCGTDLCTAGAGWDGPTGLGTPDGTGAF